MKTLVMSVDWKLKDSSRQHLPMDNTPPTLKKVVGQTGSNAQPERPQVSPFRSCKHKKAGHTNCVFGNPDRWKSSCWSLQNTKFTTKHVQEFSVPDFHSKNRTISSLKETRQDELKYCLFLGRPSVLVDLKLRGSYLPTVFHGNPSLHTNNVFLEMRGRRRNKVSRNRK